MLCVVMTGVKLAALRSAARRAARTHRRAAGPACAVATWRRSLALAITYYVAAQVGYAFEFAGPVAAIVWLPVGRRASPSCTSAGSASGRAC